MGAAEQFFVSLGQMTDVDASRFESIPFVRPGDSVELPDHRKGIVREVRHTYLPEEGMARELQASVITKHGLETVVDAQDLLNVRPATTASSRWTAPYVGDIVQVDGQAAMVHGIRTRDTGIGYNILTLEAVESDLQMLERLIKSAHHTLKRRIEWYEGRLGKETDALERGELLARKVREIVPLQSELEDHNTEYITRLLGALKMVPANAVRFEGVRHQGNYWLQNGPKRDLDQLTYKSKPGAPRIQLLD